MGSQPTRAARDPGLRPALDAIRLLVRKLRLAASATEKSSGLSMAQLFVLQRLAEASSLSLSELAARTLTDQSSVSVVVKRLVAEGLVSRKESDEDRRRLRLSLTGRGRARLKGAPRAGQEALLEGLGRLPVRDRRRLAALLSRVTAAMGTDGLSPHLMFDDEGPVGRSRGTFLDRILTTKENSMRALKNQKLPALLLASLVLLAAGCPANKPAAPPQPTAAPEPTSPPTVVTVPTYAPTPAPTPRDVLTKDVNEANRAGYLKDTYYDFDKADVRLDARDTLTADAEWLRKHPSVMITIEGHCDERGTREYNLALGDKRANAARDYLQSLGVDAGRIKTVSYGKERPFAEGHDEDSWQKNRRAHFVITAL